MAISYGPNLGLMQAAALGENVFADEKKRDRGIDGLIQCVVKDKDLTAPPGSESDGDMYIVASVATGDWAGKETYLARYQAVDGTGYEFFLPKEGWSVYVQDEDAYYRFDGSAWGIPVSSGAQPLDAELTAIAGLTSAANKGIQFTGSGTAATYDLTAAGKALLDDADAAAQRTTLGLGTVATLASDTDGTLAADSDLTVATQKAVKTYVDTALSGVSGALADGDYGDVTVSGTGTVMTIDNGAVTGGKIASSVALAGSPTTTTQSAGDNSTKIATTAYVDAAVTAGGAGVTAGADHQFLYLNAI